MQLRLTDVCDGSYFSRADGERLRTAIEESLRVWPTCEVDFQNIRIASISFLDEAIALLALKQDEGVSLVARVGVSNMTTADKRLLDDLIAKRDQQRQSSIPARHA